LDQAVTSRIPFVSKFDHVLFFFFLDKKEAKNQDSIKNAKNLIAQAKIKEVTTVE